VVIQQDKKEKKARITVPHIRKKIKENKIKIRKERRKKKGPHIKRNGTTAAQPPAAHNPHQPRDHQDPPTSTDPEIKEQTTRPQMPTDPEINRQTTRPHLPSQVAT
jgi:hypothetical protein